MPNNKIYWIWLSRLIDTVSLETLHNLLKIYKNPKNIWELTNKELKKCKLNEDELEEIQNIKYRQNLENYLFYMEKEQIHIITYKDKTYPKKLRHIYEAPLVLYAKGNINCLNYNSIGIVGCRKCSEYGKFMSQKFSAELAKKNIVVVSGLARGIDTWAHLGCMKANGKTIAVLGSGLDIVYPAENRGVFNKIVESGGAVVSEYLVGTKPNANHFPKRNRIISGLSDGVLLIEARQRSGSFITVDCALEQGKDVFAVPGDINRATSNGTNELIKQGAKLVTNVEDILEEVYFLQ